MVDVRVNLFNISAARGSRVLGWMFCVNLLEMYDNIWYRGSRGEEEKTRLTVEPSTARPACMLAAS